MLKYNSRMLTKAQRKANQKAYELKFAKENPDTILRKELRRHYGLTLEDYREMLKNQNNACKICQAPPKEKRRLCVDHCHKTGKVRGLLCDKCNKAIGLLNDDIKLFENVIEHLRGVCSVVEARDPVKV